jgi:hypothetical protein
MGYLKSVARLRHSAPKKMRSKMEAKRLSLAWPESLVLITCIRVDRHWRYPSGALE